jgi:thiol:disulfide interchange protein
MVPLKDNVATGNNTNGRLLLLPLLAVGLLAVNGCSRSSPSAPTSTVAADDHIPWRTDYDAALAEGKKTGKPILIDFSATWCPPCQEMKRSAWPDSRVADLASSKYIPLAMDVDAPGAKDPASRYGINTIPAVLVVDSDGKVLRQASFMSADDLAAFLSAQ